MSSSQSKPSVLLIGASGAFGVPVMTEIVRHLDKFERVAVLAAPEKKMKFLCLREKGVDVIVGSFLDEEVYQGFDTVISLVGNSLMADQIFMFSAALRAGVTHLYPSEYNSDLSQPVLRNLRYFRDKYAVREFLSGEAAQKPNPFHVTLLETGIFTEWAVSEFYGVDTKNGKARTYGRGENELCVTSIPDIARYLVESVLIPFPANTSERTLRVVGERLPFQRLLDTLGEVQSRKYDVEYLDPAEAKQNEVAARARGDEPAQMMWSVKPLAASGMGIVVGGGVDNERFGWKAETVRETFERVYGRESARL